MRQMQTEEALGKERELEDRNVFGRSALKQNHFVKDTFPKAKILLHFTFLCSFSFQEGLWNNPSEASWDYLLRQIEVKREHSIIVLLWLENTQVRITGFYTHSNVTGMKSFFHLVKSIQSLLVTDKETEVHMWKRLPPGLWSPTLRFTTISTLCTTQCIPVSVSLKPLVSNYSDL